MVKKSKKLACLEGGEKVSIQLKVTYLNEMPPIEKKPTYSKYELEIRKFLLMKQMVAQVKAQSAKQASTIIASFRREIKKHGHEGLRVSRRGNTIYLVKDNIEYAILKEDIIGDTSD